MIDIIIKSLASAVVTALILVIAKYSGPKLAGAIGGIPIVFAISYVFITADNPSLAKDFLVGGIYGALAAIIFSVALIFFNFKFADYHWINFAAAYALCFGCAYGMVYFSAR